jgi:uncharacterized protein YggU (UPF0235/DUF167 family)
MIGREFYFHDGKKGGALAVRVSEGAGENQINMILDDGTLLINLKGHPEDLNKELVLYLSKELGIGVKRIDLIAGQEGEDKLLSILDIEPDKLQALVLSIIS